MEQRTDIASLGEFALIDHLTQDAEIKNASTVLSIGDDAAVIHGAALTVLGMTDAGGCVEPRSMKLGGRWSTLTGGNRNRKPKSENRNLKSEI